MNTSNPPSRTLLVLAFAAIYIVWGSTYLAIRIVVETIPAFTSAAIRFLVAGGLFFLFLVVRGAPMPTAAQWRHSFVAGTLLLVGGNGLVVWAEKSISSGLTAVLVALAPVWFALLNWVRPGGTRPRFTTVAGIAIGFLGVILLVGSREGGTGSQATLVASLVVIIAGISWAGGSLYSKHSPNAASPWMNAAAQMICGGLGLSVVALLLGEPFTMDVRRFSTRSVLALGYLIVFGSWLAFSAYIWLLGKVAASRVSTYAYVNPVIAILLGWLFLGEIVTTRMMLSALVVIAGVVVLSLPGINRKPEGVAIQDGVGTLLPRDNRGRSF